MATFNVIVYRIEEDFDEPYYSNGYRTPFFVHVRLDDSTNSISVQIRDASGEGAGSLISSPTSGPNLFFGHGGRASRLTPDPLYKFCDGTTLRFIFPINTYPHGQLGESLNAVECQIAPVCDLEIGSIYTVTPTSGPSDADGAITVTATSSNGSIEYSLDENFTTSNTTGIFTGLYTNEYTVYARDTIGCLDSITVTVPITTVYGPKHRLEYSSIRNVSGARNDSRIDIEERAYEGSVIDANGGPTPFTLRYKPKQDNKYPFMVPSEAEIQLRTDVSEQYIELFTGDDRKYRVKFYKWESGWVLKWVGYVLPQFYAEPYLNTPFITSIVATDNLQLLETRKFYDEDGNVFRGELSKIQVIAQLLKKTGLELNIRCCDNVYETTMDMTATDDPLEQSYVDARIFYGDKKVPNTCAEVIEKLIGVKGAGLCQSLGYWWIIRHEQSVGTLEYREFTSQGVYSTNSTINTLKYLVTSGEYKNSPSTSKVFWREGQQLLQLLPNYGEFAITHNLSRDNNMIDSGSFESEYIKLTDNGSAFFEDWNFQIGQGGIKYGYEVVNNGNSIGAFFADFDAVNSASADNILYSKKFRVSSSGRITLKFHLFVAPDYKLNYSRVGYRVKLTNPTTLANLYLFNVGASGSFIDDTAGVDDWNDSGYINDLYIERYNSWQTYETSFIVPGGTEGSDLEISFHFHNHASADTSGGTGDFSELQAVNTSSRLQNIRRKYHLDTDAGIISAYELQPSPSTESESLPTLVQPDDYGVGNASRWKLLASYSVGVLGWVNKILIDEVSMSEKVFISDPLEGTALVDPPGEIDYGQVTNQFNFNVFEKTTYLGDLPSDIPNADEIYRGYVRLADGTPSVAWTRKGLGESKLLNAILLEDYIAQMAEATRKLSGTLMTDWHYAYIHTLNNHVDNRKFKNCIYELDDKQCSCRVDLLEVAVGNDGLPPPENGAFKATAFSDGFKIGG